MLYKICRICPNTRRWQYPTKKINENKTSFTGIHGFGFEDWLNRDEWVLSGYSDTHEELRYTHIQGLYTKTNMYEGEEVSILFYVKEPKGASRAVALLKRALVIDEDEAFWAAQQIVDKGWYDLMASEVSAIGGDISGLPSDPLDEPRYIANVKFRPTDLCFFDVPLQINPTSFYYSSALYWDGVLPTENFNVSPVLHKDIPVFNSPAKKLDRFSEDIRMRREQAGKSYIPRQAPIQNKLAIQLRDFFIKTAIVTCEENNVDIVVKDKQKNITFVEIKPASTARAAIRLGIGQLLEYTHYPENDIANKLIIVSDAKPCDDDFVYINSLHNLYGIPIEYIYWDPNIQRLSDEDLKRFI